MNQIASSIVYKNYKTYNIYRPKIITPTSSGITSEVLEIDFKNKEEAVKAAQEAINKK